MKLEELEALDKKYEDMTRYEKTAYTKMKKYGSKGFAEWGKKGGSAKVKKGFAKNPQLARDIANKRWWKDK
jgi:hypothetical protein